MSNLYESAFRANRDAMVVADTKMHFVAVNRAASELFGVQEDELIGRRVSEFSLPTERSASQFATFLAEGVMRGEYRIRRPDGTVRRVLYTATSNIEPGLHLSVLRDLGEDVALEQPQPADRSQLALLAASVGTWEWDLADGRVIWSPELQAVHGLQPGEFDGTFEAAEALIHPLDLDRLRGAARRLGSEGRLAIEYRIIRPDGDVRWLSVQGKLYAPDNNMDLAFAVGVSLDITEQKQQQTALSLIVNSSRALASSLDYESTLRTVAELAVPDLADWCSVHVRDAKGDDRIVALHHRDPRKTAWAWELLERFPPDPDAPGGASVVIRSGRSIMMEHISEELYDGLDEERLAVARELDLSSYICVPMSSRGRIYGAIAFASAESRYHYDAKDLEVAEHMARRAAVAIENAISHRETENERAKFEVIVSTVGYGVCHVTEAGEVTYMNAAAADLLGISSDDALGRTPCDVLHGRACDSPECGLSATALPAAFQRREAFTTAQGESLAVELLASPLTVQDRPNGTVLVFHDIRKQLEQERAKDDFVAFASHELRSPLTPVLGMASWLSRKAESAPEKYDSDDMEAIVTLKDESERLARVVDTFLDLSRIEAGRLQLDAEPLDIKASLEAELASLRQRYPEAHVTLEALPGPIHAISDSLRFRQVAANLLENAVKYGSPSAPQVKVTLSRDAKDAVFSVTDNGPGIADHDLPNIFSRFYRAENESVRRRKGLGIGLYITKQIVDAADGSIVADHSVGPGATFTVRWPLRAALPDVR